MQGKVPKLKFNGVINNEDIFSLPVNLMKFVIWIKVLSEN